MQFLDIVWMAMTFQLVLFCWCLLLSSLHLLLLGWFLVYSLGFWPANSYKLNDCWMLCEWNLAIPTRNYLYHTTQIHAYNVIRGFVLQTTNNKRVIFIQGETVLKFNGSDKWIIKVKHTCLTVELQKKKLTKYSCNLHYYVQQLSLAAFFCARNKPDCEFLIVLFKSVKHTSRSNLPKFPKHSGRNSIVSVLHFHLFLWVLVALVFSWASRLFSLDSQVAVAPLASSFVLTETAFSAPCFL